MMGIDIFGNEVNSIFVEGIELKPIERFDIQIPDYFVSRCGKIWSSKTNKWKKTFENCEKFKKDPNEENKNLVKTSLNKAFSLIDKAVKKNVLHKNNGANRKSKINNIVKTTFITR